MDLVIFEAARIANVTLISKDSDFVELVLRKGSEPKLVLLTCGNVSNTKLQALLSSRLNHALTLFKNGDVVELV